MVRYPRIRLERSSSHQRLLLENQHQKSGADLQAIEENQTDMETQRMEASNRSNGCTFKISGETSRRQPHFKIYFTPRGGGDQDVTLGSDSTRNSPKVNYWKTLTGLYGEKVFHWKTIPNFIITSDNN